MSEAYDPWRNFNEMIGSMALLFFFLIATMTVHLYTDMPPVINGVVQWVSIVPYSLIGIGELLLLGLSISSRIEIYRMDHPKKVYPSEQICEGAVS